METNSNVLIVDDDTDICHLMESIMDSQHLASRSVNRLQGVLQLVADFQPDLVFIDNQLPAGFGIEQIPTLKASFPDIKVVLITGDQTPGLQQLAHDYGADLLIRKPFSVSSIKDAL